MKTVIFLHHPVLNDTFAYFPLEKWDRMGNRVSFGTNMSYDACSPDYAAECEDATDKQYEEIKQALLQNKISLAIYKKNDMIKSK